MDWKERATATEARLRQQFLQALEGDAAAYQRFLAALSGHLRAFFRKRLSQLPDEVEDLVQETLLAVHNSRHTYKPDRPLTAWVHTIARYKLVDLLRSRSRHEALHEPLEDEVQVFSMSDDQAAETRRDLDQLLQSPPDVYVLLPMFWLKLVFPASVAVAALVTLRRLGYPGMRLGRAPAAVAAPVAAMWVLAGFVLLAAAAGERLNLVLGDTWMECPVSIALLSVPATGLTLWAVHGLAPTRLSLAGATAGLFAGAAAAFAYALHCPEMQAPFLAVWYLLGMLIPAAAGAYLGPRLLRW